MCVEYAQLLSTAHRVIDGEEYTDLTANGRRIKRWRLNDERESKLMKATHINHPSAIWCRENLGNYIWLFQLYKHLCDEYTYRYGKVHACARLIDDLCYAPSKIKIDYFFAPTPAMPSELKVVSENPVPGRKYDSLKSYHKYYLTEKIRFAKWKNRNIPEWFKTNAHI